MAEVPTLGKGTWAAGADGAPCHVHGFMSSAPVTMADVDQLLSWHVLTVPEMVYLARGGIELPSKGFTVGGVESATLDADVALDQVSVGATLSIVAVHRQLPAVEELLRVLSQRYTAQCAANLYLSGPGAAGGLHHDMHDVLIVQLSGAKQWQLYDPPQNWPDPESIGTSGPEHSMVELRPGDALHIPPGWPHLVSTPHDAWSLHLTIGLRPITPTSLELGAVSSEPSRALSAAALRDASLFADEVRLRSPADLEAARQRAVAMVFRSGSPSGRLSAHADAHVFAENGRLVPRHVPWIMHPDNDGPILHAGGRQVRLPIGAERGLGPAIDGRALAIGHLVDRLGNDQAMAVAQLLTMHGLARYED